MKLEYKEIEVDLNMRTILQQHFKINNKKKNLFNFAIKKEGMIKLRFG